MQKNSSNEILEIKGSSGVAGAWGFHHYLKYYCNCHVSWEADQLNLPKSLPDVVLKITANDWFVTHCVYFVIIILLNNLNSASF